jgi:hypothetical protein
LTAVADRAGSIRQVTKVFWFFFSKKNIFFDLYGANDCKVREHGARRISFVLTFDTVIWRTLAKF